MYFPHCISNWDLCYDILFHLHFITCISIFNFFFLVAPRNLRNLSSLTTDWTQATAVEVPSSNHLDHQGMSPFNFYNLFFFFNTVNWQCCASFRYIAKWFSYICVCVCVCVCVCLDICTYFPILFSHRL